MVLVDTAVQGVPVQKQGNSMQQVSEREFYPDAYLLTQFKLL